MKETEIAAGFIGFITLGIWLLLRPLVCQFAGPGCLALDAIVVWCSAPTILGFCSELLLIYWPQLTSSYAKAMLQSGANLHQNSSAN
jgi:hypothetical protein